MPKFYARFKETKEEVIEFSTQEQRDDWVNFQDEFSLSTHNSAEVATFQRMHLTEREAKDIIKSKGLIKTIGDLGGVNITLFRPIIKTVFY